ncbi:MAG: YXWGXW repeat-containing protein [Planctomycetota bacterium]|jgi:hypothetical protein
MRTLFVSALLVAGLGCAVHLHGRPTRKHVIVHEVKVEAPPPAPPRVVVVKGRRPGQGHVWIGGHYVFRHKKYVWEKGHWAVPPRKHAVWVKGYWKRTLSGGLWVAGHWQ